MVALDSSEKNLSRLAEFCSEAGDGKQAAAAFFKLAQQAEAHGGKPSQWYERAYAEDAGDESIALGYAKCLIQEQQVGAAIFVLEPLASTGTSPEFRELYARALLSANRLERSRAAGVADFCAESVTHRAGARFDWRISRRATGSPKPWLWR